MKTKTLFLTVLLATSTLAFGNHEPEMVVFSVKGSEVIKVIYKGNSEGKVKLSIFNAQGNLILKETVHGLDAFIFPLNFKGLQSGDYVFELKDDAGVQRKRIYYQACHDLKNIRVSKIHGAEGKFLFTVTNSKLENIHLNIYDNNNRLVHSESKTIQGDFAQVYKILHRGKYTFEVSDTAGFSKHFVF